jgi:multiple sugar transport system ATP-binding protein
VQLPDGGLIVADGSQRAEPCIGDAIRLQPDLSRAHLFDAAGHAHHAT